jgi:hypothetical protein
LNLPIRIVYGHLGKRKPLFLNPLEFNCNIHLAKLKCQISSYKSLLAGTGSIQLNIDGLTILIAPKPSVNYDAEKETIETREKKLKKVKKLLEQEKRLEKSKFYFKVFS